MKLLGILLALSCTASKGATLTCIHNVWFVLFQLCEDPNFFTNEVWDTEQWAPYSWSDDVWVGYDNKQSVLIKVC